MPAPILDQTQERVDEVRKALSDAVAGLDSSWFKWGQTQSGIDSLKSLTTPVELWAARGLTAAKAGKAPDGANGWHGWIEAGNVYIAGINDIYTETKAAPLSDVVVTVQKIPEHAAEDVKAGVRAVAKTAGSAVAVVAEGASDVAFSGLRPLIPLFAMVAIAIGGLIYAKSKLLKV